MKPFLAKKYVENGFVLISLVGLSLALIFLATLLIDIISDGASKISFDFFTGYPSRRAEIAGIFPALTGTFYLMILTALCAVPIGVAAAIYFEEYAGKGRLPRLLELNIANLAGIPSIIYGLLGLQLFVHIAKFERSLISGALTLSLLILPVIIIGTREALKQVPNGLREGSLALGATKWQTIWNHVLPNALPGIMTACILGLSRAIGEAAPLVCLGALTYVAFLPDSLFSPFTALPIQSFNWISRPQEAFHENAAGAVLVLLMLLLILNSIAVTIRMKYQKQLSQA